jgi:hypothetical protein
VLIDDKAVSLHERKVLALIINEMEGFLTRAASEALPEVLVVVAYLHHEFSFHPQLF